MLRGATGRDDPNAGDNLWLDRYHGVCLVRPWLQRLFVTDWACFGHETRACQHCQAPPELVIDGRAQLSIVRHGLGCPILQAQVRARWPDEPTRLPDTPAQIPFERRAAFGRWHRTVQAREKRRK